MLNISKISLGTVQLGTKYGIANTSGKPDLKSAMKILKFSWENGITSFDTSPGYGESEKILGSFIASELGKDSEDINIITKLSKIELNENVSYNDVYSYIKEKIHRSLEDLKIQKIHTYLLHHAPDIFFKNGIVIDCLNEIAKEGLIDNFGLSIYNTNEVEESLKFNKIKAIQIPMNIFDHRLLNTGLLKRLKERGYIVYTRSIYLQGLFFRSPESLPKYIELSKDALLKLREIADQYNTTVPKIAFLYVRDMSEVSSLVIGAEKVEQIADNLKILTESALDPEIYKRIRKEFSDIPEKVINPHLWKK